MLKNESAQNETKLVPLRPSHLLDFGGIVTLSNGLRMEKISHSVQKVKQVKKGMTVQSVQSMFHADCADRTIHTGDVAVPADDTWQSQKVTRGSTRRRHVSSGFGHMGVQLDLFQGDTCHHCKGDMWHG
jgi:hypothetical protein